MFHAPRAEGFRALAAAASTVPDQNVVGVGEQIVDDKPTGAMALKFLVRVKFSLFRSKLSLSAKTEFLFSAAGDSGSLILERSTNKAIALLFAGSSTHTIANYIEDVLQALKVTLA